MAHEIRPLGPDDLPGLGRFLTGGFGTPADAPFAAPDVLRWKYFDPRGGDDENDDAPRSFLAVERETGRIVGHVGTCPGRFRGGGGGPAAEGVSTLHMIDWLTSDAGRGAGATLMRRAHRTADTQYSLGASDAARRVLGRGGYELVAKVPVYQKVLRTSYRRNDPAHGPVGRWLRVAKDAAAALARPSRPPSTAVALRPVASFGPEIEPVLASYRPRAVFSSRGPGLLNHALRYPRGGVTGWHVVGDGGLVGFALLSVVSVGVGIRVGRVVDCLLGDADAPGLWHAALSALTAELARRGADAAVAFASTPWSALALKASGYAPTHALEFRLRDRGALLPRHLPFHLTPLEADYAYT